jgi:hypothetical protein
MGWTHGDQVQAAGGLGNGYLSLAVGAAGHGQANPKFILV